MPEESTDQLADETTLPWCRNCERFGHRDEEVCKKCKGPWLRVQPVYQVTPLLLKRTVFADVLAAILVSGLIFAVIAFILGSMASAGRR